MDLQQRMEAAAAVRVGAGGALGGGLAGGYAQQAQVKPMNAMQEINARLAKLFEAYGVNTDRMNRVVDRAFGAPKGENVGGNATPRAVPNGEIAAVMSAIDTLEALAKQQAEALSRIDGIV